MSSPGIADKNFVFPGGKADSGNGGVVNDVKATPNSIGYTDYSDAKAAQLTFAEVKNADGKFVAASLDGATAAVAGATVNPDLSYDPLFATGAKAYPITAPTYILVYKNQTDAAKGNALKAFLSFIYADGQDIATDDRLRAALVGRARQGEGPARRPRDPGELIRPLHDGGERRVPLPSVLVPDPSLTSRRTEMALDLELPPTRRPAPLGDERQPGEHRGRDLPRRRAARRSPRAGVLGLILYSTTDQAWAAFQHEGIDFVTQNAWYPSKLEFGALSLIWGTLLISLVALLIGGPDQHRDRPLHHRGRTRVDAHARSCT